jgi:hypothetical protein
MFEAARRRALPGDRLAQHKSPAKEITEHGWQAWTSHEKTAK